MQQRPDPEWMDRFIADTRSALFVRRADNLLMIRPDKTMAVNETAASILEHLYERDAPGATEVLRRLAPSLGVSPERLTGDAHRLLEAVGALLNEDYSPRPGLRMGHFDRGMVKFPTLAEIALTYGCQNRCSFCYASSPYRESERRQMTTAEVEVVMGKIFHQAHVPSLSFTGGEATLRRDLPDLIARASEIGFRVNLITNGIRLADPEYAERLVASGLNSAQISLEAGSAATHDLIVGRPGAFEQTTEGVRTMRRLGIHVHTNTTLCRANIDEADDLIRFVARDPEARPEAPSRLQIATEAPSVIPQALEVEQLRLRPSESTARTSSRFSLQEGFPAGPLGLETMSMNMVIRTGEALTPASHADDPASRPAAEVGYAEVAARLPALLATAQEEGVRLVWYSPIPYCLFNPVLHGLGAKSCACVDGILSVDPSGQVLPCSSFDQGLGSLLEEDFDAIYSSRAARYWREKQFVPPACGGCPDVDVCAGACPLYWDAAQSFAELPLGGATDARARARWERRRRRGGSFGVAPALAASTSSRLATGRE